MQTPQVFTLSRMAAMATCTRSLALAGALAIPLSVLAQQPPGDGDLEGPSWGLGMVVGTAQSAYKGMDRDTVGVPMISYENQYVKLSGPTVELKLPGYALSDTQRLHFGLIVNLFDGSGYEASDSPALAGMAERKSSVWVGARMEWENDLADVSLEALGDASSNSKGSRVTLGLSRKWMLSPQLLLIPQVDVEWVDKKYVDYYYGVRGDEARAGRAAYVGKATVSPEISLTGLYRFDKQHSMMLNAGVKILGKGIKNSSIVDRSSENHVMVGYMYSF